MILCAYEWSKQVGLAQPTAEELLPPAPQAELEGMIAQLDALLEPRGYYFPEGRSSATRLTLRSLLTKPEPAAAWEALQERLHTPASVDGFPASEVKARAQEAEANGEGLLLIDVLRLRQTFSFRRYRADLVGLAGALGVVVVLIACAFAIAHA